MPLAVRATDDPSSIKITYSRMKLSDLSNPRTLLFQHWAVTTVAGAMS